MTATIHAEVTFTCKARGPGPIHLVWNKINGSLPEISRRKVVVNSVRHDITSTLIIQHTIGYDKGMYYCTATNYAGIADSEEAYLHVTGKKIMRTQYIKIACKFYFKQFLVQK